MKKTGYLYFNLIFLAVILSTLGGTFWLFDLFSHFYLQYWIVLVVLINVFIYRGKKFHSYVSGLLLIVVTLELGAAVLNRASMIKIPKESAQVRVFEFNTQGRIDTIEHWLPTHAGSFDVVVLLEAHLHFHEFLEKLKSEYPYQVTHLENSPFGIAVLSRWEITGNNEFQAEGGFYPQYELQIKMPSDDEFLLYAMHAPPPFAAQLAEAHEVILGELSERVNRKKSPAIVVGDLNTTARSYRFLKLVKDSNLRDTAGISPWATTWPSSLLKISTFLGIRIDHCLVSNSFSLVERERLEDLGSDHMPVVCTVQIEK